MQAQSTRPEHSVLALSIPTVTARMLEHVADNRGLHIDEMAAILLQLAAIEAAAADRAEEMMAEQGGLMG